jgi:hypothetical protein
MKKVTKREADGYIGFCRSLKVI